MHATDIVLLLVTATVGLVVGRAVGAPAIVAYLAAGMLVGPAGVGLLERTPEIERLAELGVTLLLFGIGIEFSLARLRRVLGRMVASGGLQIALTVAGTAVATRALGYAWPVAVAVGCVVALSSTAIVFKLYDESGAIDAPHGQAAAAILLAQDLALVPMMLLVPALAGPLESAVTGAVRALVVAVAAVAGLLVAARTILPAALRLVARLAVPELFPLAALVVAFGTALAAAHLGLSLPIGAFLAGLALSASPHAHQVFAELLPLRDASVALFFTSVGLLVAPDVALGQPGAVAAVVGAAAGKGILVAAIVGFFWRSWATGVRAGFGLAQIGEFSFVLAVQARGAGLLDEPLVQAVLAGTTITMALTPVLVELGERLARAGSGRVADAGDPALRDHVVLVGCGETGLAVARVLRETGVRFVAVDLLAENVARAVAEGLPARFGDATRRAVLGQLGIAAARAVVVTVADAPGTRQVVALARQMNAEARVIVRARRVGEIADLERLGADEVIPSEFETSIELFARLLRHLGVPRHVIRLQESVIRAERYRALRGLGAADPLLADTRRLVAGGILETAEVMAGSPADGCTLAELELPRRVGVTLLSIVRDERPLPTPAADTRLRAGDLLVVFGPHAAIDRALHLLEPPEPTDDM